MKRWLSCAMIAGVACALSGCGSGASSPTAPAPGAAPAPSAAGATIQGTVTAVGATSASAHSGALHAFAGSAGVTVSVVGAALSTVSDDSGHFELHGVAPGRVDLRFQAPGVDAHLEIEHVGEGETLQIEVRVEGSRATTGTDDGNKGDDDQPGSEVEFTGTIGGLSPLVVAGRTVVTDASTRILDHDENAIPLSALRVGDRVEVEGTSRSDGSVLAKKIKQEDDDDDDY